MDHTHRSAWRLALTNGLLVSSVLLCACLDPHRPYLATRDSNPPQLLEITPQPGGTIEPSGYLELTFSEAMDPRSLRPGLYIVRGNERIPTAVLIPEPREDFPQASQQVDIAYPVRVQGVEPLEPNTSYALVFDEVLTDTAGNQLVGPDGGVSHPPVPFRTTP